jgi:hypothetical protein
MRRYMRKPQTLKMKEYMARIEELNNYLKMFPGYHDGMELQDDELLDLYEFGVPTSWQKQFLVQNWDPIQHSKQEFRKFCERLEMSERISTNSPNNYPMKNNNSLRGKPGSMSGPKQYGGRVTTSAPMGNTLSFRLTRNNV